MENLIHVYTAPDKVTAQLVKSFLEENGIKTLIKANPGPHGAFFGGFGGAPLINPWLIYVPRDKERQAKEILKNFKLEVSISSAGPRGKALASFILGLAWLWFWYLPFISVPIQIAGIMLGIMGIKSSKKVFAILGTIFSIIGLIVSLSLLSLIIF